MMQFWLKPPVKFPALQDPIFLMALKDSWDVLGVFYTAASYEKSFRSSKSPFFKTHNKFEYVGITKEQCVALLGRPRPAYRRTFIPILRQPRTVLLRSRTVPLEIRRFSGSESYYSGDTLLSTAPINPIITRTETSVSSDNSPPTYLANSRIKKAKSYSKTSFSDTHAILTLEPAHKGYRRKLVTTSYDYMPLLPSPQLSDVRNIAVIRCLASIKDMDVNLGAAIGEGKQTLSLVLTSARRIATTLSALHRRDFTTAIKALGLGEKDLKSIKKFGSASGKRPSVSSLWLELQYGWLPLLGDIHGTIKTLEKAPRLGIIRFQGSAKEEVSSNFRVNGLGWGNLTATISQNAISRARCTIYAEIQNPLLATLSSVGLTNPASVAWELTPFSFVVDWFLPIGKYLDILDAGVGWKFLDGTTSTRLLSTSQISFTSQAVTVSPHEPAERQVSDKRRYLLSSFPIPTSVRLKDPRSLAHFLNSTALIRQLTKKG